MTVTRALPSPPPWRGRRVLRARRAAAALAALAAACGARSGPLPASGDGGVPLGEPEPVAPVESAEPAACASICADIRDRCPFEVTFTAGQCQATCDETGWFDECTADCAQGNCECYQHCFGMDELTCAGYCAWLEIEECAAIDPGSCQWACRRLGEGLEDCVNGCGPRDCDCVLGCM